MTAPTRCGAETFDGIEARQCTRPVSSERDGLPVCWQHAKLPSVRRFGGTRWRVPREPVRLRTADDILADFRTAYGFTTYTMAGRIVRTKRQDDADYLAAEYREAVRDVAIRAAFELQDIGLDDDAIVGRLREAMSAA